MQLFLNNWEAMLIAPALAADTELEVDPALAAQLVDVGGGNYYIATLVGFDEVDSENSWEIVRITAAVDGVLTVDRAQEGTTAADWAEGTPIRGRLTAGTLEELRDAAAPVVGEAAPTAAPGRIAQLFFAPDDRLYIATGAAHTEQWVQLTGVRGLHNFTATVAGASNAAPLEARAIRVSPEAAAAAPVSLALEIPAWPVLPAGVYIDLIGSAAAPMTVDIDLEPALDAGAVMNYVSGFDYDSGADVSRTGAVITVTAVHPVRIEILSLYSYESGEALFAEGEFALWRLPYSTLEFIELSD